MNEPGSDALLPHPATAIVAVVGPTAAGKAGFARKLAEQLGWGLLVCDSVKAVRGLDIGSAKPSPAEQRRWRYEGLDLVAPDADFGALDWCRAADTAIARGPCLVVGGTGFYLRAWAYGVDPIPGGDLPRSDPERAAFEARWTAAEREHPGAIHAALAQIDGATAATIDPRNVVRCLRALWLCERHGGPLPRDHAEPRGPRTPLRVIEVDPGAAPTAARIEARAARMLAEGWLAEVEGLVAAGYTREHKAMRSLGYAQLLDVVSGAVTLPTALAEIVAATRRYARRQRTFVRHQFPGASVLRLADHFPQAAALAARDPSAWPPPAAVPLARAFACGDPSPPSPPPLAPPLVHP